MRFSFFEEYPTPENFARLDQLEELQQTETVEVFIAAKSYREFESITDRLQNDYPFIRFGYWPVLEKEEGYWLSPFAQPEAVVRILHELTERESSESLLMLWDAELPILDIHVLMHNAPDFFGTKRMILDFFERHRYQNIELVTAEYPTSMMPEWLQQQLGIGFEPKKYDIKKVKMMYTSFKRRFYPYTGRLIADGIMHAHFIREVALNQTRYGDRFGIGIGCLAHGVLNNEPVMTPKELESDLGIAQEYGVKHVYLFRLGGLERAYLNVLLKFI